MKYILIILCFFSAELIAQSNVLYLKNGQTLESNSMRYRNPLFGKERIVLNNQTYFMREIDSFKMHSMHFVSKQLRANARYISARPLIRGKINLYDHVRPPRNAAMARIIPADQIAGVALLETSESPIDWFHHTDLVRMIKNHPKALDAFKESRKIQTISTIGTLASLGLVISPVFFPKSSQQTIDALLGAGLLLSFGTDIYWIASADRYRAGVYDAIITYNKQ